MTKFCAITNADIGDDVITYVCLVWSPISKMHINWLLMHYIYNHSYANVLLEMCWYEHQYQNGALEYAWIHIWVQICVKRICVKTITNIIKLLLWQYCFIEAILNHHLPNNLNCSLLKIIARTKCWTDCMWIRIIYNSICVRPQDHDILKYTALR